METLSALLTICGESTGHKIQLKKLHYDDVIMSAIASQITSLKIVYSTVYSGADQRKHQSSASLAFVWGIHRDRWIPRTKGQLRGKCFHLMTSSCDVKQTSPSFSQGIDTTALAVGWALFLLGQHSHVYTKLQAEVDTFFGKWHRVNDAVAMVLFKCCSQWVMMYNA